jgi:hypothetical protein
MSLNIDTGVPVSIFFDAAFPSEAAFSNCTLHPTAPEAAVISVEIVADPDTVTDDSEPTLPVSVGASATAAVQATSQGNEVAEPSSTASIQSLAMQTASSGDINTSSDNGNSNSSPSVLAIPLTVSLGPTSSITIAPSALPSIGSTVVLPTGGGATALTLSATTNSAGQTVVAVTVAVTAKAATAGSASASDAEVLTQVLTLSSAPRQGPDQYTSAGSWASSGTAGSAAATPPSTTAAGYNATGTGGLVYAAAASSSLRGRSGEARVRNVVIVLAGAAAVAVGAFAAW